MTTRLGVDVGGTFTDLIFYDDATGEVRVAKEPTTPQAPEVGIRAAIAAAVPADRLRAAEFFLHGTTVGLNALLERHGARGGLLTTRGFRDILEIRRGDRDDPYDLFWKPAPPLVPRHLRLPVTERMLADGTVHIPLDADDVRNAADEFLAEGVESVAIVFLHAYANPAHERKACELLRAAGFKGQISLSHAVSGEYREYERTTTTVIDAYIRPRVESYLHRLRDGLSDAGFGGQMLIMRSGGGAMGVAEAEARPFETLISGPVAGAEGAAELSGQLSLNDVITADAGGTSFDTCVISDGRVQVLYEGKVAGLPLQTPWVDIRSIGAGGGSIAWIDVGGLLRVGPESAGAEPGPVCYGKGGTQPTVTDAAAVLGMLGEGNLSGGIHLDRDGARDAFDELADRLSLTVDEVAQGVLTIAAANMGNAMREITIEQGRDPRDAALMAFGGAGPLFATLLASELDIPRIVIPPHAGNFSAWGLLGADLTQSAARTRIMPLSPEAIETASEIAGQLFGKIETRSGGHRDATGIREVRLDMRYAGQEHSITVAVPASPEGRIASSADEIEALFTADYERTFAHTMDDQIEIVSIRADRRRALPRRSERSLASEGTVTLSSIDAYSFTARERLPFRVLDRSSLPVNEPLAGPAIILEKTATTHLDAGWSATVHPSGALLISMERDHVD